MVAGVAQIVLVVPPIPGRDDGAVDPAVLVVCRKLGVTDVFRVNGPAGVAAMGFGTESIPQVRMIVGPGSPAVTLAQIEMQRYGVTTMMLLGPTESVVIADGSADPSAPRRRPADRGGARDGLDGRAAHARRGGAVPRSTPSWPPSSPSSPTCAPPPPGPPSASTAAASSPPTSTRRSPSPTASPPSTSRWRSTARWRARRSTPSSTPARSSSVRTRRSAPPTSSSAARRRCRRPASPTCRPGSRR